MQRSAVIAAQLAAVLAEAVFDGNRVGLAAVAAEERIADAVIAIGREAAGEEVVGPRLVKEIVLDDAILIAGAAGVQ